MNKLALGTQLTYSDQQHVLGAYCHRFTGQHKPDWATKPWKDGKPYPLHYRDDADWLANTKFHVRNNGRLDLRFNQCEGSPTWPNNPELRRNETVCMNDPEAAI